MQEKKRRSPTIAFFLSLLFPGLGQLYCGYPFRGFVVYFGLWIFLMVLAMTGLILSFKGLVSASVIMFVCHIALAADAALIAGRLKEARLKWYNRWYVYVAILILSVLSIELMFARTVTIKVLGLKAFRMPANSMSPALETGDCFLVKLQRYGHRRPKRGDIVVFPYPENKTKIFAKRVIGLPGERLQIEDKKVFINGRPLKDPWGVHHSKTIIPARGSLPRDNYGPVTIPEGSVFVMGDNRDASHDSRFWGCVKIEDIEGKALFIYWSPHWNRIDKRLD